MLTYLAEEPELFGGAKLLVNEEVLLIIYMGKGLELPTDLLATLAEDVEAKAFVPLNATSRSFCIETRTFPIECYGENIACIERST